MDFDLSQDYLYWDNTESGVLTGIGSAESNWDTNQLDWDDPGFNWDSTNDAERAIAVALGTSLTRRELAASDGVYTPRDKTWLLPAALLGGGEPKPRDIWTDDATGTAWTILDVSRAALGESVSHYICPSRNLILEHSLTDAISIERCAVNLDAAGAIVQTWPPDGGSLVYAQLACGVQPITSDTGELAGIRDQEETVTIFLSRQISINMLTDRVNFAGVIYDIVGYRNPQRIDELPILEVKLRP